MNLFHMNDQRITYDSFYPAQMIQIGTASVLLGRDKNLQKKMSLNLNTDKWAFIVEHSTEIQKKKTIIYD